MANRDIYTIFPSMKPEKSEKELEAGKYVYNPDYVKEQKEKNEQYKKITGHAYQSEAEKNRNNPANPQNFLTNPTLPTVPSSPTRTPSRHTTPTRYNTPTAGPVMNPTPNRSVPEILKIATTDKNVKKLFHGVLKKPYLLNTKELNDLEKAGISLEEYEKVYDALTASPTDPLPNFEDTAAYKEQQILHNGVVKDPVTGQVTNIKQEKNVTDWTPVVDAVKEAAPKVWERVKSNAKQFFYAMGAPGAVSDYGAPNLNYQIDNRVSSAVDRLDAQVIDQERIAKKVETIEAIVKTVGAAALDFGYYMAIPGETSLSGAPNLNFTDERVTHAVSTVDSTKRKEDKKEQDARHAEEQALKDWYNKSRKTSDAEVLKALDEQQKKAWAKQNENKNPEEYVSVIDIYKKYKGMTLRQYYKEQLELLYKANPALKSKITLQDLLKGDTITYTEDGKTYELDTSTIRDDIKEDYTTLQDAVNSIQSVLDEQWKAHQKEVQDYREANAYTSFYDVLYNKSDDKTAAEKVAAWINNKGSSEHPILNEFKTFDVLAAWVKGATQSLFDDDLNLRDVYNKIHGLDPEMYGITSTMDYDTGIKSLDFLLEAVSDPVDWVELGFGALGKKGAKGTLKHLDDVTPFVKEVTPELNTLLKQAPNLKNVELSEALVRRVLESPQDASKIILETVQEAINNPVVLHLNVTKDGDIYLKQGGKILKDTNLLDMFDASGKLDTTAWNKFYRAHIDDVGPARLNKIKESLNNVNNYNNNTSLREALSEQVGTAAYLNQAKGRTHSQFTIDTLLERAEDNTWSKLIEDAIHNPAPGYDDAWYTKCKNIEEFKKQLPEHYGFDIPISEEYFRKLGGYKYTQESGEVFDLAEHLKKKIQAEDKEAFLDYFGERYLTFEDRLALEAYFANNEFIYLDDVWRIIDESHPMRTLDTGLDVDLNGAYDVEHSMAPAYGTQYAPDEVKTSLYSKYIQNDIIEDTRAKNLLKRINSDAVFTREAYPNLWDTIERMYPTKVDKVYATTKDVKIDMLDSVQDMLKEKGIVIKDNKTLGELITHSNDLEQTTFANSVKNFDKTITPYKDLFDDYKNVPRRSLLRQIQDTKLFNLKDKNNFFQRSINIAPAYNNFISRNLAYKDLLRRVVNSTEFTVTLNRMTYSLRLLSSLADSVQKGIMLTAVARTPIPWIAAAMKTKVVTKLFNFAQDHYILKNPRSGTVVLNKAAIDSSLQELERTVVKYNTLLETVLSTNAEATAYYTRSGILPLKEFTTLYDWLSTNVTGTEMGFVFAEEVLRVQQKVLGDQLNKWSELLVQAATKGEDAFKNTLQDLFAFYKVNNIEELTTLLNNYAELPNIATQEFRVNAVNTLKNKLNYEPNDVVLDLTAMSDEEYRTMYRRRKTFEQRTKQDPKLTEDVLHFSTPQLDAFGDKKAGTRIDDVLDYEPYITREGSYFKPAPTVRPDIKYHVALGEDNKFGIVKQIREAKEALVKELDLTAFPEIQKRYHDALITYGEYEKHADVKTLSDVDKIHSYFNFTYENMSGLKRDLEALAEQEYYEKVLDIHRANWEGYSHPYYTDIKNINNFLNTFKDITQLEKTPQVLSVGSKAAQQARSVASLGNTIRTLRNATDITEMSVIGFSNTRVTTRLVEGLKFNKNYEIILQSLESVDDCTNPIIRQTIATTKSIRAYENLVKEITNVCNGIDSTGNISQVVVDKFLNCYYMFPAEFQIKLPEFIQNDVAPHLAAKLQSFDGVNKLINNLEMLFNEYSKGMLNLEKELGVFDKLTVTPNIQNYKTLLEQSAVFVEDSSLILKTCDNLDRIFKDIEFKGGNINRNLVLCSGRIVQTNAFADVHKPQRIIADYADGSVQLKHISEYGAGSNLTTLVTNPNVLDEQAAIKYNLQFRNTPDDAITISDVYYPFANGNAFADLETAQRKFNTPLPDYEEVHYDTLKITDDVDFNKEDVQHYMDRLSETNEGVLSEDGILDLDAAVKNAEEMSDADWQAIHDINKGATVKDLYNARLTVPEDIIYYPFAFELDGKEIIENLTHEEALRYLEQGAIPLKLDGQYAAYNNALKAETYFNSVPELSIVHSIQRAAHDDKKIFKEVYALMSDDGLTGTSLGQVAQKALDISGDNATNIKYTCRLTSEQMTLYRKVCEEERKIFKKLPLDLQIPELNGVAPFILDNRIYQKATLSTANQNALRDCADYAVCNTVHSHIRRWANDKISKAKANAIKDGIIVTSLEDLKFYLNKFDYEYIVQLDNLYKELNITNVDMAALNNFNIVSGRTSMPQRSLIDDTPYTLEALMLDYIPAVDKVPSVTDVLDMQLLSAQGVMHAVANEAAVEKITPEYLVELNKKYYDATGRLDSNTARAMENIKTKIYTTVTDSILKMQGTELQQNLLKSSGGFVLIDKSFINPTTYKTFENTLINTPGLYTEHLGNNVICIYTDITEASDSALSKVIIKDAFDNADISDVFEPLKESSTKLNKLGIAETFETMSATDYRTIRSVLPDHIQKALPDEDLLRTLGYMENTKNTNYFLSKDTCRSFMPVDGHIKYTTDYIDSLKKNLKLLHEKTTTRARFIDCYVNNRIRMNAFGDVVADKTFYNQIKQSNLKGVVVVGSVKNNKIVPKIKVIDLSTHTANHLKQLNPALVTAAEAKQLVNIFNNNKIPNVFTQTLLTANSIYKANALTSLSWLKNNLISTLFKDIVSGCLSVEDVPKRIAFLMESLKIFKQYDDTLKELIKFSTETAPEGIRISKEATQLFNAKTIDAFFKQTEYAAFKDTFFDIENFLRYGPASITNTHLDEMAKANIIKGRTLPESLENRTKRFDKTYASYIDTMSSAEKNYRMLLQDMEDVAWKNGFTKRITDANNCIEQVFRYDTYRWERELGGTFGDASAVVTKVHFDYDNAGIVKALDFAMPFINYQYNNILYWTDTLWKNPTLARWLLAYYKANGAADLTESDLENNELWATRLLNGSIDLSPSLTLTLNSDAFDFVQHLMNPTTYKDDIAIYNYGIKPWIIRNEKYKEIAEQKEKMKNKILNEYLGTDYNQYTEEQWMTFLDIWEKEQQAIADNSFTTVFERNFSPNAWLKINKYFTTFVKQNENLYQENAGTNYALNVFASFITSMPSFFAYNGKKYFYHYDSNNVSLEDWQAFQQKQLEEHGYVLPTMDQEVGDKTYSTWDYNEYQKLLKEGALSGSNTEEVKHYVLTYKDYTGTEHKIRTSDKYTALSLLSQEGTIAGNDNAKALAQWMASEMPEGFLEVVDTIKNVYRYSYLNSEDNTVYLAVANDEYTAQEKFFNAAITGDINPTNALAIATLTDYADLLHDPAFIKTYDDKFKNVRYSYIDADGNKVQRCIREGANESNKNINYAILQLANGVTPENDVAKTLQNSEIVQRLKKDRNEFYKYANENDYYVIHWDFINKDFLYTKNSLDKVLDALRKGGTPATENAKALMKEYNITPKQYTFYKRKHYNYNYSYTPYPHKAPINKFFYGGKQYVTRDPNKFQNALQNGATLTPNAAPHKVKHGYAYNKARYYQKHPKTYNWTPHKYNRYNSNFYTNSNITTTVPYSTKQKSYRKRRVVSRNMMQRKYRMKYKFNK